MAKALLDERFEDDVDLKNAAGKTKLHLATERGDLAAIKILLDMGASIDVQDRKLYSPLHTACLQGHTDVVRYLLRYDSSSDEC